MIVIRGGGHCGSVRFSVSAPPPAEVLECNCSICAKTGYLHWIVADAGFAMEQGADALTSYRFGTGTAEHLFCATCGIKPFYRPRSHPGGWSVNFRCLDPGHGLGPSIRAFDGRNWDQARADLG
ncbi:MAG TPA: GFA family protein [Novosphingobium sp.]|nr:GFA family protein [Novosphingobium sp.]